MNRTVLALLPAMLGFLLCPPVLLAQEGDADAKALEAGRQLVAGLKDYDASLAGTYWLGIHLKGAKNIGKTKMVIEQAPAGSGAVYRVVTDLQVSMGPMNMKTYDDVLLDACCSTINREVVEEDQNGKKLTSVKKTGDTQVGKISKDGKSLTSKLQPAVLDYWEIPSQCLLLRKIPLDKPATYLLKGVDWPAPAEGAETADVEQDLPADCVKNVRIIVPAASKVMHRGAEVQAYLVRIERDGQDPDVFALDAQHRLLSVTPVKSPIVMVAGTEEEAGANLGPAAPEAPGTAEAKEAMGVFLDVIAGVKEVDQLDTVMDWKAIREAMAEENEALAAFNDEGFAKLMKDQFKAPKNEAAKAQIAALKEMLEFKMDGDNATVTLPGQEKPYVLKKVDGKWKIVRIPS
jgi:hypothetical protein